MYIFNFTNTNIQTIFINNEIDNGYLWTIEEYGRGDATLSKYVGSISQNEDYMRLLEIVESIAYSEWDF